MFKDLFTKTAVCFATAVFLLSGAKQGKSPGSKAYDENVKNASQYDETVDYISQYDGQDLNGIYFDGDEATPGDSDADSGELYVEQIELPEDFYTGVDISSYLSERESGVIYYDYDGNKLDDKGFFLFLKSCGINTVRIRVWNNPYDAEGNGYGGGNCDINRAVIMGKFAVDAGLKVMIDFHYSDFWADPAKQNAPKEWAGMSLDEKAAALHDYTVFCLEMLKAEGIAPEIVQIGNETTKGFCGETSWTEICKLLKAGSDAVHEVSPETKRAVHFTDPDSQNYYAYAKYLDNNSVDYEIFATSFYPYWHGDYDNLKTQLEYVTSNFDKDVMVVETSYVYTYDDGDSFSNTIGEGTPGAEMNYMISEQGQANLIHDITKTVTEFGDHGVGVFYWEPAWIPVRRLSNPETQQVEDINMLWEKYGSGWATRYGGEYDEDAREWFGGSAVDNQALFDFDGHPLRSLKIFDLIRNGSDGEYGIVDIEVDDVTAGVGDEIALADMAVIRYTDDKKAEVNVSWDQNDIDKVTSSGSGEYVVKGKVSVDDTDYDVSCNVKVSSENLLKNPGFEEPEMKYWTITDDNSKGQACVSRKNDMSNVRNGEYCLHFWSGAPISYRVEQTVFLKKGRYVLGSWIEGGDAGTGAEFKLYAKNDKDVYSVDTGVTSWKEYKNPEINDIVIDEDGTKLTIGVAVKCDANGWGAWDDFYLYSLDGNGGVMPGMEYDSTETTEKLTETSEEVEKTTTTEEKNEKKSTGTIVLTIILLVISFIFILAFVVIIIKKAKDEN